jgi:hypothetical protein
MPLPPLPELQAPSLELGPVEANADSAGWQKVAGVLLYEVETGAAPQQATTVKVARSGEDLRVLFICVDAEPWATMTRHDDKLYEEEVVEVFLDPVGDLEVYFEIEVNPLNTVLDLVLRKAPSGRKKDFAWNCEGLRTAVQRTAHGWNAELAIPFESLMPDSAQMPAWRCNFTRIDRPKGQPRELSAWSVTGAPNFHVAERFGVLRLSP